MGNSKTIVDQALTTKQQEIKKVLSESQDMVGEKTVSEGIFHKIFRGYIPLDLLSNLKLELEGERREKIYAYCDLLKIALRHSESVLDYLVKGYGTTYDEIQYKQTANDEYKEKKLEIKKHEEKIDEVLKNPYLAINRWFNELGILPETLRAPIVNPFQIDEDAYVPPEVLQRMSNIGLFKLKVPKEYGGIGFSQKEYDLVLNTLAHISGTLLAMVSAHNTIGSAPLMMYGTEEQKNYYLREVAKGEYLAAFGLTEPTSGTDAIGKMKCTAKLSDDGKFWIINGEKVYITNIHRAGLMYMMAKTDLGKGLNVEDMRPTVFIVGLPFRISDSKEEIDKKREELLQEGLRMSKPLDLMMIRGSNQAHIIFNNFKVPVNNVLGEIEGGSKVIFNGLNKGRAGFGASSAEASRVIFESALSRVSSREMFKAFGGKQSDLPQVKKYISHMAVTSCALRAISDMTTAIIEEHGDKINIIAECAAIKVLATEGCWDTATYAMRLWGGTGTMRGHSAVIELAFRDAWIGIVVEGVNEAMKQLVTGVGVQAVKNDADIIGKHLFFFIKPKKSHKKKRFTPDFFKLFLPASARLLLGMLRFERGGLSLNDAIWLQFHAKLLSIKTAMLGIVYGNNMVLRQLELIRMSDIAMDLYSLAAVQIKLNNKRQEIPKAEVEALNRFVLITKKCIRTNLSELKINNQDDKESSKVADLWIEQN